MRPGAVFGFALLFIAWVVVGLMIAFDALAFISSLIIVLPVAGALTGGVIYVLDHRHPRLSRPLGMAVGAAAMPLFIA